MEELINNILNEKDSSNLLKEYLEKIGKKEYFFLIENLIKISKLKSEIGYTTPLLTLRSIKNNTYKFDIKNFIESYTKSSNELEKQYYLNIIRNGRTLSSNINDEQDEIENATNYLNNILDLVSERGIIILNPMDAHTRYIINRASDKIERLQTYTIFDNNESRIVLRYITNEKTNITESLDKGKFYYCKGNFENAIQEYKKIIRIKKQKTKLSSYVYMKIGLSYAKLKQIGIAIDYLILAIHLLKENNIKTYLLETIEKLEQKNNIDIDEKTYTSMSEIEFLERNTNNLTNVITELLKKGYELNDIIKILNLNEEEKMLSLIVEAQTYYKNEQYNLGDKNLLQVEKSLNKTEKVITELIQTRKDKKLYKHR